MTRRTSTVDPVVTALRGVTALRSCPDKQLARLARLTDRVRVPAGHVLMREGTVGREAFVIVEGEATVTIDGASVATLGPGEFVGELALLDLGARTATVVAGTPMVLLAIGPGAWMTFVADPAVSRAISESLASRLRAADANHG